MKTKFQDLAIGQLFTRAIRPGFVYRKSANGNHKRGGMAVFVEAPDASLVGKACTVIGSTIVIPQ